MMFRDKERKLACQRVEAAMVRNGIPDAKRAARVAVAMLWEEARAAYGMGVSDGRRELIVEQQAQDARTTPL